MTKKYSTKRALIASILVLCMCFSMLIGTTFAWFTDSVTSSGNVIQTGKLDVAMYWAEGDEDPAAVSDWKVADGAIFNNDKWEPGYSEAKHIKIANEGTLALKYQLAIVPNGEVSKLADVIDVYFYDGEATQVATRDNVDASKKIGTLADLINNGIKQGSLEAGTDYTATLVLKMQETADNDYQGLSIGSDFSIRLLATQYTDESDSFGDDYDADAWMDGMLVYSEADLNAAIANGGNVVLGADVELQSYVTVAEGSTVAINLNGHKLSAVSGNVIRNSGELTIVNGTLEGTTTYTVNNEGSNGVVTIENVKSVNGGFFNAGSMVVNNCEITNTASEKHALVNSGDASTSLVVNGGTYSTTSGNAIVYAYTGTIAINGGDFTQIGSSYMIDGSGITINGGTFTDDDGTWAIRGSNHTINGGTFNFSPSSYVADGFTAVQIDGVYHVVPDTIVEADLYIMNAEQLVAFAADVNGGNNYAGKTVALFNDIDLANVAWTPINGFKGTFNGNGKTISNLNVVADKYAGMFGYLADSGATITNLTIDGANVTANTVDTDGYAGVVLGYHYSSGGKLAISDVKVTNSTVTGKNGGAIAGSASMITVSGCASEKNTINASRNGGIIGTTLESSIVDGCTVSDNTQNVQLFESESAVYVGTIVGRVSGGTVQSENVIETIKITEASTQDALNSAVSGGSAIVTLSNGNYTMPATTGDVSIYGTKDTVITVNDITAKNVTFNGVTVVSSGNAYTGIKHSDTVVYNDCVIVGNKYLYAKKVVFNNCTFDLATTNDYIWVYGATNVEFNSCTFNTMGKAILVFQDGSTVNQTVKVEGCTFNASAPAYNWDKTIHISAVSMDGTQGGTYNVILNNNTVDEDFNGLWQDKTSAGNITVTVDGETVLNVN